MKPRDIERFVPLLDIEIDRSGDGRTVTAYAATFDEPYEVRDFDGHYDEVIDRTAFNRALGRGIDHVGVFYNHGRNLEGQPSDRFSLPIGTPLEIKAEARGLVTVTRYAKTPLADEVLELIRDGAIKSQSFRGAVISSARPTAGSNGRPVIRRTALGLREYGPTKFPANNSAAILAVRSSLLAEQVGELSETEREELLALLQSEPHLLGGPSGNPDPQSETPEAIEPEASPSGPSVDLLIAEAAQRRRRLQV